MSAAPEPVSFVHLHASADHPGSRQSTFIYPGGDWPGARVILARDLPGG